MHLNEKLKNLGSPFDFIIPRTFTMTFGPRGFAVTGPTAWNSLPAYLKNKDLSPHIFRSGLKTHCFSLSICFQPCFAYIQLCFGRVHFCLQAMQQSRNGY